MVSVSDFGLFPIQSRSKNLSTRGIKTLAATKRVERGTSIYMAPELLTTKYSKTPLTVKDTMVADVFAFGMLIRTIVILKEPFMKELVEDANIEKQFEASSSYNNEKYPAILMTSCRPERTFGVIKRVNTRLRSTMEQERLWLS